MSPNDLVTGAGIGVCALAVVAALVGIWHGDTGWLWTAAVLIWPGILLAVVGWPRRQ